MKLNKEGGMELFWLLALPRGMISISIYMRIFGTGYYGGWLFIGDTGLGNNLLFWALFLSLFVGTYSRVRVKMLFC